MTDTQETFVLDPARPFAGQVPGLIRQQVDEVVTQVDSAPPETAVHEARKMLKRLRALLRLARGVLGEERFQAANRRCRDAARTLASYREHAALLETIEKLADAPEADAPRELLAHLHERLAAQPDAGQASVGEVIAETRGVLLDIAAEATDWTLMSADELSALHEGLRRTYCQGRRRLDASRDDDTAEALHEWRKSVKYLWSQLLLLVPLWPAVLHPLAEEFRQLSDLLGNEHDLHELQLRLSAEPSLLPDDATREMLATLIKAERTELQRRAFALGALIYTEQPCAFADRFSHYWALATTPSHRMKVASDTESLLEAG